MSLLVSMFVWSLPLISGALDAASRSIITATKEVHTFTVLAVGYLAALPLYTLWLLFIGVPEVHADFWLAISLHVPLLVVAMILTVEAHKSSPLATTLPYMSLTPAFLLVLTPLGAFFFSEVEQSIPTGPGALGVLILVVGLYVLNMQTTHLSSFDPIRSFWHDRGARLMFFAAILLSITSVLDLVALKNANAPFYLLIDHALLGASMFILILIYRTFNIGHHLPFSPGNRVRYLAYFGLFLGAGAMAHLFALDLIPVVPYIIAGKRAGAIIFGLLFGLALAYVFSHPKFQGEREHIRYRIPGTLIAVLGMVIIIVWGNA